jgi:hypothetical protein
MNKLTPQERKVHNREAEAYNARLTAHLFQRMIWNRDKPQYKKDYENRFKKFKKMAW